MEYKNIFNPFTGKLQKGYDDTELSASLSESIQKTNYNVIMNAFRIAINGLLSKFNLIDSIVDDYQDETGISAGDSSNYNYDSVDKLYTPLTPVTKKLLLHFDGTDGQTSTVDSTARHSPINFNGATELDTAIKKFGTASLLLPGANGDYLDISGSADFNIFGATDEVQTVDFWVKHADHVGQEVYFGVRTFGWENYYGVQHFHGTGLGMTYVRSGGGGFGGTTTGAEITDTNLHHIALIIKNGEVGLYLDGIQTAYDTFSGVVDMSTRPLVIGDYEGGGNEFKGSMDEFHIANENTFSASPNVGLTDTIVVPTAPYDLSTQNMTLVSDTFEAEAQPEQASIVLLQEDVDAITINTDIKAYASRNDGVSWSEITLQNDGEFDTDINILTGNIDISGQSSGTDIRYKVQTFNNKNLKLHASAEMWD